MRVLHVVPGLDVVGNGIAVAAKLLAAEQGADLVEARLFARGEGELDGYDEVWVHSCWLPMTLKSCCRVLRAGKPLVRMTHANLDPVRLKYHGWKKWLVGPIERWCLRRCAKIVATCEEEKGWIQSYLGKHCPPIEVTDIKRFFNPVNPVNPVRKKNHLLYLGRQHPLKGLEFLEAAVKGIEGVELRVVSNAFGDEKEKVWEWCDVLVLPTLSDNFGLVIAEALERCKYVVTTDGAPAWGSEKCGDMKMFPVSNPNNQSESQIWEGYGGRLIYLRGYRDGAPEERVRMLKEAIEVLICQS